MTTKLTNRLTQYLAECEAHKWGTAAAIFNEPVNPYPAGCPLAVIWQAAFNNQLAVIADKADQVTKALAGSDALDAAEPQPVSWFQTFIHWLWPGVDDATVRGS